MNVNICYGVWVAREVTEVFSQLPLDVGRKINVTQYSQLKETDEM